MRNLPIRSPEAEFLDKTRQEMLRCFSVLCHDKAAALEEIDATLSAMRSILAIVQGEGGAA